MAASDLQDRLDYLVSYSSQLIFITGDLARQSDVLEAFIDGSSEQVEVALLAASTTCPLAKYREKLFKQLISSTAQGDFNRPLNLLLADLNQHDGPIIISMTKAENMPLKLLQELWALVLQSRFANNRQYLNVLLFAEESWAKQAQNSLKSKTGDKPLLLNRSSIKPNSALPVSSKLDKLIEQKRQQFSRRSQQDTKEQRVAKPLLKKRGLIALFLVSFIVIFGSLVSLLYSKPIGQFFTDLGLTTLAASHIETNATSESKLSNNINKQPEIKPDDQTLAIPKELPLASSIPVNNSEKTEALVTTWRTAIAKVEENSSDFLLAKPQEALINPKVAATTSVSNNNIKMQQQTANIQIEKQVPKSPATMKAQTNVVNSQKSTQNKFNLSPLPSELIQQKGLFFIQISAMSEEYLLSQFIEDSNLGEQMWIYTTQRFGGDWYVLLFQKVYKNLDQARNAIRSLPTSMQAQTPFIKTSEQIQQELRQLGR